MRRLVGAGLAVVVAVALAASTARSQPQQRQLSVGYVGLDIRGWGSVRLGNGFQHPTTVTCTGGKCGNVYPTRSLRATLTATPYHGWRFAGWRGACTGSKRTCVVHIHPATGTQFPVVGVRARFRR